MNPLMVVDQVEQTCKDRRETHQDMLGSGQAEIALVTESLQQKKEQYEQRETEIQSLLDNE